MTPRNLPAVPAFIVPLEMTVPVDGVDFFITALGVEKLAQIIHLAAPVLDQLVLLPDDTLARLEAGAPNMDDLVDLLAMFDKHRDVAVEMVAIATNQPVTVVGVMLPDRFAYLFAAVVMVNADFFSRARPVFAAAGAVLAQARAQQEALAGSTGRPSGTP